MHFQSAPWLKCAHLHMKYYQVDNGTEGNNINYLFTSKTATTLLLVLDLWADRLAAQFYCIHAG